MRVQIATRHTEVPDEVQLRARELIEKLRRFDADVLSAEVVFEEEKHVRKVEGILSVANSEPVVASGESGEWLSAIDQLNDRLGRILKRRRGRQRERQSRAAVQEFPGN
jgi:ribosomal subunit interface protein